MHSVTLFLSLLPLLPSFVGARSTSESVADHERRWSLKGIQSMGVVVTLPNVIADHEEAGKTLEAVARNRFRAAGLEVSPSPFLGADRNARIASFAVVAFHIRCIGECQRYAIDTEVQQVLQLARDPAHSFVGDTYRSTVYPSSSDVRAALLDAVERFLDAFHDENGNARLKQQPQ
jgi:hypothetical protein